ncbi:MAG: permease [Gammaproteobacteria bacterium]|nr:permease [Gammaproteobacteria bacterium]
MQVIKDPVFITLLLLMTILMLVDSTQLKTSIIKTLTALWEMLPFFALAIGIAAYAKASQADALIARAFSGNPLRATILAALVGAISPFCSCGVIPLIAAMLGAGVPLAPVMAFWIASPIMDPEMFVLTAAGIGINFAIAKTIAAMAMGLFAGLAVLMLQRFGYLSSPLQKGISRGCAASCESEISTGLKWKFWHDASRITAFKQEATSIGIFLGKWLTLAFFLETLMVAYISSDWIIAYVGEDNPFAIPLAAVVGAPSYLNGYAAIPLISGLVSIGMTPGAAMAFITAGAVSSIPAAIAVYALVKKPVFMLYLLLGLSGAMLSGWAYQISGLSI